MQNKIKGFTIVELIFAILVIGILALISVPVYRGYVRKSISTEGKNLLSDINVGERSYFYRTGNLYATSGTETNSTKIGVDARRNKYFKSYSITTGGTKKFTATTSFSGKTITLIGSATGKPEIIDNYSNLAD